MIRALYSAASGMNAQQLNVDNIANNLANANSAGYKMRRAQFQDLLYQNMVQPGASAGAQTVVPAGLQLGLGTRAAGNEIVFTQGDFSQTNNPLDVVIQGKGFFQIRQPSGNLAYTRAGSFQLSAAGAMVDSNGNQLEPQITIPPNAQVQIASDGTISAAVGNNKPQMVGKLKLVTPEAPLQRGEDGLFRAADGDLPADPNARLQDGALEGSNVSAVESMVAMISAARQFEAQMKMLQTAEGDEKAAAQLLSMN